MEQPSDDIAVPEADAAEQATDWVEEPEPDESGPRITIDVSEADAVEQTQPGLDDEADEFR